MIILVLITILWAFSFSLIGVYLAGQVDNDFAVLTRVLCGALVFLPLLRWRGVPGRFRLGMMLVGASQFGITYLLLYRSFAFLTVPEVLLFTVFTPIYITLLDDALHRRFAPVALLAAALATLGAGIIRYDGLSESYITGFIILQGANLAFAAGQVGYRRLYERYSLEAPAWRLFGYFFLGAILVALPSFLAFGDRGMLPATPWQWLVLGWLGFAASGAGLFFWNQGARKVDAGTLAVMNNALVPAGLLVNLLIWNRDADLFALALGGGLIGVSLWVNQHFRPRLKEAAA